MKKRTIQFSLQSMFICCIVGAVLFSLNLRSTVTIGEVFLSIEFPPGTPGNPNMNDWLMVERGFPLRYQQSREVYPHGSLSSTLDDISTSNMNLWSVTHAHWLIVDICFGLFMTTLCVWGFPRVNRLLRRSAHGKPSTNHGMQRSGGNSVFVRSMSTPAAR